MKYALFFFGGAIVGVIVAKIYIRQNALKSKVVTTIDPTSKVVKTVNNLDGTVTYYYDNGTSVTETTNKK